MFKVGTALGTFINSGQKGSDISELSRIVKKVIDGRPLFSEEWLPDAEADDSQPDMMEKMIYWNI
jgi:glycine hydroxymethyltransferase